MTDVCNCRICSQRMAAGQAPLPGVSTCQELHLIEEPKASLSTIDKLKPAKPPVPITRKEFHKALDAIATSLGDVLFDPEGEFQKQLRQQIESAQAATLTHVKRLEARVAELEEHIHKVQLKAAHFAVKGPWKEGKYAAGNLVTFENSLWSCLSDTTDKPPSAAWKLVVRAGTFDERPSRRLPTMQRSHPR